jgi:hypothetical protein
MRDNGTEGELKELKLRCECKEMTEACLGCCLYEIQNV